ncbi:MAG: hypothetical protein CMG71_06355 [Candidatus Marinimicrobia bacterium]|nr:hypothetical protein [Candidatus Neomarinimicrobiota bacterium]
MMLRSISIFVEPGSENMTGDEVVALVLTILPIVATAVVWMIVWMSYVRKSTRVNQTFDS